ncbi:MAG: GreA/GreB family elongation factor [Clostridia bacterium]|nr:GreA/GreB family elongation factor [Clostridia bacterium]
MHDELTKVDILKMKEELESLYARMPELRENVRVTRGFGDLSENDEYKTAKREINAVKRRTRYLENMIKTAVVIDTAGEEGKTALFDFIHIAYPEPDVESEEWERRTVRVVTTLRNDVFNDCISKESPVGRALLGRAAGEVVTVSPEGRPSYLIKIESFEKGEDDPDLPIAAY